MSRFDRPGPAGVAAVLRRTLGLPGLVIAGLAALMFGSGLVVVRREYDRLEHARVDTMGRLMARWVRTASADYLGSRNLVDDAEDWRRAGIDGGPARRALAERLARMGDWFEEQNRRSPIVEVVGIRLLLPGEPPDSLIWHARNATAADAVRLRNIIILPASKGLRPVLLEAIYRPEPEVARMSAELSTSYRRLLLAVLGLSGYSMLCLVYMGFHAHALHATASREAAQQATLDLADRTCHELGNVAFVLSNERRNLADHLELVGRFLDEWPEALDAALHRARLEPEVAERVCRALRREHAARGIEPEVELRAGAAAAADVCRQIAVCSDYIALTVRELDGYLKQSALPVALGPVDVVGCLDDARALLGPSLDAAIVRLDPPAEGPDRPLALADRRLLVHALVNLLKNALEATKGADREPLLGLSASVDGSSVRVEVADNGPGIPPDVLPRIFDLGFSTKAPGRGRGLAIVRDSIEAQGGTLTVASRPGRGTTFRIGLPGWKDDSRRR